jgi:molecular chaperone GrpE
MSRKPPAEENGREPDVPADQESRESEAQRSEREAEQRVERDLDELGETRRERDEYLELAKRTRADFENYRKRVAKESAEAAARGKAELARGLIPVIDNLERALRAAGVDPGGERGGAPAVPAGEPPSEEVSAHEALARGVALVHQELRSNLDGAGVEAYDPVGDRFDPALHEALSTRPADGTDAGVVLETLEKGYRLDGQVLRPARVVVSA